MSQLGSVEQPSPVVNATDDDKWGENDPIIYYIREGGVMVELSVDSLKEINDVICHHLLREVFKRSNSVDILKEIDGVAICPHVLSKVLNGKELNGYLKR